MIEKNLTLPVKVRRKTKWAQFADDMEKGDSMLLPSQSAANALKWALRNRGKKHIQRKQKDGKVRVWRVA